MPDPNQPIGSQPGAQPCDPCFDPGQNCQVTTEELAKRLCAVEAQYKEVLRLNQTLRGKQADQGNTLNQLLEELAKLRELISELTGGTEAGCSTLEGTLTADGVQVCDGGTKKLFKPQSTPYEIVFCGGRAKLVPRGLRFYPLETKTVVLSQSNMASNNAAVTLPNYPSGACGEVWAVFEATGQAFPGASSSGTNVQVELNGYLILQTGFFGDFTNAQPMARVTSANSTFNVTASGSGVRGATITLIGYMY